MANRFSSGPSGPTSSGSFDSYRGVNSPTSAPPGFGPPRSGQNCNNSSFQSYFEGGPIFKISFEEFNTGAADQFNVPVPYKGKAFRLIGGSGSAYTAPGREPFGVIHFRQFTEQEFMRYSIPSTLVGDPSGVGTLTLPPGIFFQMGIANQFTEFEEEFDQFYVSWRSAQVTGDLTIRDQIIQVFGCPAASRAGV